MYTVPFTRVVYIEATDFREQDSKDFYGLAPGKTIMLRWKEGGGRGWVGRSRQGIQKVQKKATLLEGSLGLNGLGVRNWGCPCLFLPGSHFPCRLVRSS